jgi:hypothetical protein
MTSPSHVSPWMCALGLLLASSSHAASVRLDDSGSYAMESNVRMQWRSAIASTGASAATEASVRVQIRIDTRAYAGQQGRVYMVLPQDAGPPLRAEWQTQGRLLPGSVNSGGRTLVYAGPLPGAALEDQLSLRLRSDVSWLSDSRRLNFYFELDTP